MAKLMFYYASLFLIYSVNSCYHSPSGKSQSGSHSVKEVKSESACLLLIPLYITEIEQR